MKNYLSKFKEIFDQYSVDRIEKKEFPIDERAGFFLEGKRGNNVFCYAENKKLWIPPLIKGEVDILKKGNKTVIRDLIENQEKEACGLSSHLYTRSLKSNTPTLVVDNHNYILDALIKVKNLKLFHIDLHRDEEIFSGNIDDIYDTRVCDYIDFAKKRSFIQKDHYSVCSSFETEKFLASFEDIEDNLILNIDLDFFVIENDFVPLEKILELVVKLAAKSQLICLATSPLFIDEDLSIELAKVFLKNL